MIRRDLRFHGHNSLKYVYAKGLIVRSRSVSLKYVSNDRRQADRLAVVVSRKVHKSAVVRNRIRRRVYESIRKQPHMGSAYDLVFLVYDDSLATDSAQSVQNTITALRRKAGLTIGADKGRAIVNTEE